MTLESLGSHSCAKNDGRMHEEQISSSHSATVRGKVNGRDRQYHIEYDGKDFKRDISKGILAC